MGLLSGIIRPKAHSWFTWSAFVSEILEKFPQIPNFSAVILKLHVYVTIVRHDKHLPAAINFRSHLPIFFWKGRNSFWLSSSKLRLRLRLRIFELNSSVLKRNKLGTIVRQLDCTASKVPHVKTGSPALGSITQTPLTFPWRRRCSAKINTRLGKASLDR